MARHGVGVFGGNFQILIGELGIVDSRHDSAGHVLGAFDSVERRVGLQRDALHGRVQFFEATRGPDEGAAGAEHRDKMRNASLGLLPDFVGGPVIVRFPVGVVGILVGIEILIGMLGGELAGQADGAVGAIGGIGIKNVGAIAMQDLLALARNVFRHAQGDGESFGRSQHGVSDASVAAGGVEKNFAGAKLTAAAGLGDDVGGGAIFDRSAGVVPFGLTQKCYARQVGGERVQTQQRSVADALEQAVAQRFAQS